MNKTPINLKFKKFFRTKLNSKSLINLKKATVICKVVYKDLSKLS